MVSGPAGIGKSSWVAHQIMHTYFVRIGALAEVHAASSEGPLARGRRVITRTPRGIELGEVLQPRRNGSPRVSPSVQILRPTSPEDELLIRRLDRNKHRAIEQCRVRLAEAGSTATLLDVDQLFDGGTLVMHFLGPVDEVAESVTKEIADQYESVVQTRHFSKLLRDGCGPDCGTDQGGGCGTGCAGCASAAACRSH